MRLGDFAASEVHDLYQQHSRETGQAFEDAAIARAVDLTAGQPWLVNALAREIVEELGVDPAEPITAAHVDLARERLVLARQTHLDSLLARLHEPRVRRILEPVIAGDTVEGGEQFDDDFAYVRDLGLIAPDPPIRVANAIYREVIVRVLASAAEHQAEIPDRRSFVLGNGTLDTERILREFAALWVEHGEVLTGAMPYHEVAPQLVLMAYLQRVVNGGGSIDREYGIGRGRIDLLIRWPRTRGLQREAIELKVWADGRPDPFPKGLIQLDEYLDRLGLDHGVLVVFDRRADAAPIDLRTHLDAATSPSGRPVAVLRA